MKMNVPVSLRKCLMLAAVLCLLLTTLAGCDFGKTPEETPGETQVQTNPADVTEPVQTEPPVEVPDETAPEAVMGTVTHDNLNVRSNPSTDSTVLNQLDINTRVVVIETRVVGDVTWGRIADGWINMNYVLLDGQDPVVEPDEPVEEPDEPAQTDPEDGIAGTVTATSLHIRKEADGDSESVGKYSKGDKVVILEVKGNWGRTSKGWVSMKYIKTEGATDTPEIKDEDKETDKELSTLVTDGKKTVLGYVVIDISSLNVRYGPGKKYESLGYVREGERVAYYKEKNGWIRIKDGWISKAYTKSDKKDEDKDDKDETLVSDGTNKVLGYVVVTGTTLNGRTGPGTKYEKIEDYKLGDRLAFYQKDGKWVRTKDAWVSTGYCYVEGDKGTGAGTGTTTGQDLNVRTGPGTGYKSVAKLDKGVKVSILAQIKIGKTSWGYTKDGWVSMDYIKMN